ncbi:hypothetical protein [Paracoccus sp. (in: a-proteobacteria)]|uniref:hypothetical protein n=1 Tax=Paracoccus sp. TaxID=267 RepID=UPI002AFEAB70|nr:hypothetical protein [Paracoccus sp. (in: a-proteobacteria)]
MGEGISHPSFRDTRRPPDHDFRRATTHRLADWPVLALIAARHTKARRLDRRTVAALYARAIDADRRAMESRGRACAEAALAAYPSR